MNILFTWPIPFDPLKGGVERVTDVLAREFVKRGHRVFFLHKMRFEGVPEYNYDVKVDFCPVSELKSPLNREFYRNYLLENKIDIVINQAGAFDDSKLFGDIDDTCQVCFHVIHCAPQFYYPFFFKQIFYLRNHSIKEYIKRFGRICLYSKLKKDYFNRLKSHYTYLLNSKSPNIVLLSEKHRKQLKEIIPDYPERYINSIGNPSSFSPVFFQRKNNKILLFVGRMENQNKHPDRVIKIWRRIYSQFPDWRLIMIGDGPARKEIEIASRDLPRIEFKGFSDPKDFYKTADILLFTSDYEGFGMVLIESMVFGCVPIAFNSFPSIGDLIKDERQLVTPFSINEYVDKLSRLMTDKGLLDRLRTEGYSIAQQFTVEDIVDKWENLFNIELKKIGNWR